MSVYRALIPTIIAGSILIFAAVLELILILRLPRYVQAKSRSLGRAIAELIYVRKTDHEVQRGDGNTRMILVLGSLGSLLSAILASALVPAADLEILPAWKWTVVGLLVAIGGTALRIRSVVELGPAAHRTIVADHSISLITTGPYRWIRHPAYVGSILIYVGVGIVLANAISLTFCLLGPTVTRIPRIVREERTLASKLGDTYLHYAKDTKRFVPFIW